MRGRLNLLQSLNLIFPLLFIQQLSDRSIPNISITAFLVDNCENVYVSGWGGDLLPNFNHQGLSLPITADAIQSTTMGRIFTFLY